MASSDDTERVGVRTYVPAYQKAEWKRHADELGMSQAEFVRTMVQAGRRGFEIDGVETSPPSNPEEAGDGDATPGVSGLESRVLDLLGREGHCDWEELVAGLTDDIESQLDDVLAELQESNRVRYDGREGGYTAIDDER